MVLVHFLNNWNNMIQTKQDEFNVHSYRELIEAISKKYPNLSKEELKSKAISINGFLIQDPFLEKIPSNSEVHFLERLSGG